MPAPANLVHQLTTGTGPGDLTLTTTGTGRQTFDQAFGHGATTNVFDYFISHQTASEWERGTGHMSDATTLVRDTVIESSNANAAVSFSAGTKDVMNDVPAAKQVTTDMTQTLTNKTLTNAIVGTQSANDNSTKAASTAYVDSKTPYANRVINPMGQFAQAGLASTGNAAYTGFDQWYALVQTAAITPSQLTAVENGTPFMMRLTQAQVTAQRFGIAQPLESARVIDLRGSTVSLRARIRCSASTTIRWAVIEWTGAADSITKNVVNSWTSTTYTTGNFFIATTTTIVGTGSVAVTANTLTDAISNAIGSVSSSMNNLIVFFWTDSTQAQNVTLDIGNVWLGAGVTVPNSFEPPLNNQDLAACQRYWFALPLLMPMNVQGTGDLTCIVQYPVQMRAAPAIDLSNLTNANYVAGAPTGVQWSLLKQGVAFATKTGTVTTGSITNSDLNQAGFYIRGATWSVAPENVDVATAISCSARL